MTNSPDDFAKQVSNLLAWYKKFFPKNDIPSFLMVENIDLVIGVVFFIGFIVCLWPFIRELIDLRWPKFKHGDALTPLPDAATRVYELLRVKKGMKVVELLQHNGKDGRLLHMAGILLENCDLYGRHPPSTLIETIDKDDMGVIDRDCTRTTNNGRETIYCDLAVKTNCLNNRLKELDKNYDDA